MSVPLSLFSASSIENDGLPSQLHLTALLPSFQLLVMIYTFLLTMNEE